MVYRPPRLWGVLTGLALSGWAFALAAVLATRAATWPVSLSAFLAYTGAGIATAIAVLLLYWSYACFNLHYIIGRDALTIVWGASRRIIPLREIQRLVPGYSLSAPKVRGINWPGLHIGHASVASIGNTSFYSTHRSADDLLYIITSRGSYAVATDNLSEMARDIQLRQRLAVNQPARPRLRSGMAASQPIWKDLRAWSMLLSATVLSIALAAYLFLIYPDLPQTLTLPFERVTGATHVGTKEDLLKLPMVALAVLLINVAVAFISYRQERGIAYLFLAAALGTQVVLWVSAGLAVV